MIEDNSQYTTAKVEAKDFTQGWKMALLIAATGVSLPLLFLGSEITLNLGFYPSLIAFAISTLVLTVLCSLTTIIGTRSRLSTYMILQFSFGKKGALLMNFIFALTLLGWFSVTLELMSVAVKDTLITVFNFDIAVWPIIIIVGLGMLFTTTLGVKSIERLSNISVPFLFLFLFYALYKTTLQDFSISHLIDYKPIGNQNMSLFEAISALIGMTILFPVLMADFSRFIKTDKQSLFAVSGITIGTPLVLVVAAIITIHTGEKDIMKIMSSIDMVIPAFLILIISGWITNSMNLYSTILTLSTFNEKWPFKSLVYICGLLGIGVALLGFTNYFIDFLNILGVVAPSISSIYILDFYWVHKGKYDLKNRPEIGKEAIFSWSVASSIAMLTYLGYIHITGAFFIDSILIAGILYFFLMYKKRKNTQG